MPSPQTNKWVQFLRNYGPIPNNDNMYDEHIQRAHRRTGIAPIVLRAQYLEDIVTNLQSSDPISEILTGTAGDGKTYHCREAWLRLGGSKEAWDKGALVQRLALGSHELVVVKDLSELAVHDSAAILAQMAVDVASQAPERVYLIAANHGQLLERLKANPAAPAMDRLIQAVEDGLVDEDSPPTEIRLNLRDLSKAPAAGMLIAIIKEMTEHEGWASCETCPNAVGAVCPIWENRRRLQSASDAGLLQERLCALIELSEQNGTHFPVRQLLLLAANMLLGHPDAPDGLMTCASVPDLVAQGRSDGASVYRNIFGENLRPRRAEKFELFRKLGVFGIGAETSNKIDSLLVYGADDPDLRETYDALVLNDPIYGGTPALAAAQRAYLEGYDPDSRDLFLPMLRMQRQRLFFTLPIALEDKYALWDLSVFRYAGMYLRLLRSLQAGAAGPRAVLPMAVRGLNRIFTGMLAQDQDQLVLATSGSHSQAKASPLLDSFISVHRSGGQEVALVKRGAGAAIKVQISRDADPGPIHLPLTPTRFEFLGRVAEGALPSSFSLECHEDLLAFKARLLSATERQRHLDEGDQAPAEDLVLTFIDLNEDGRTAQRRVAVRV